jgi:multidrug efflux pump subunit AcrA (membrane-fusion protein)
MTVLQVDANVSHKKKIIRNAAIIFITLLVLLTFFSKTINNFLLPEVECTNLTSGTLTKEVTSQGEILPLNTETINSYGTWKITAIKVKEGEKVAKGDTLAIVDLSDSKLELRKMELNILKLENELKLYKNGFQTVNTDQYKSDADAAFESVKKAEKKLKDQKELYSYDAVTHESVDEAEEQLSTAKRDYTQKQKLLEQKEAEIQKSGVDYSTNVSEKDAELKVARLELEDIKKNTPDNGIIKAPADGTISSIMAQKGTIVNSGQQIFEIVKDQAGAFIKWTLDSKAASQADKGASVTFTDSEKQEFNGTVKDKKFLVKANTYEYTAEVREKGKEFEIGEKLDVLIQKKSVPYPKLLPNSSIIEEGGKSCVYVLKIKDGILGEEEYVDKIEVTVTEADDLYSAVSGSITDEDKIVMYSSKPLSDNIQVKSR